MFTNLNSNACAQPRQCLRPHPPETCSQPTPSPWAVSQQAEGGPRRSRFTAGSHPTSPKQGHWKEPRTPRRAGRLAPRVSHAPASRRQSRPSEREPDHGKRSSSLENIHPRPSISLLLLQPPPTQTPSLGPVKILRPRLQSHLPNAITQLCPHSVESRPSSVEQRPCSLRILKTVSHFQWWIHASSFQNHWMERIFSLQGGEIPDRSYLQQSAYTWR